VRWLFFGLLWAAVLLPAAAETNIVQEFSGSGSTTTALFKVQDRWEVRWNARQAVSVAVMSADGAIVAGAAGVLRGSLFVPLGGQFYLKVSDGTIAPPPTTNAPPATTNAPPAASTNTAPSADIAAPPATDDSASTPPGPIPSWHLQIVQLGKSVSADQALTVYTPFFMVPDSAITPTAPSPDLPPPVLTNDQVHAMVTIKGDNAQGAGFLMRAPDGVFVVTHLRLLAANPNLTLLTNTGAPITSSRSRAPPTATSPSSR